MKHNRIFTRELINQHQLSSSKTDYSHLAMSIIVMYGSIEKPSLHMARSCDDCLGILANIQDLKRDTVDKSLFRESSEMFLEDEEIAYSLLKEPVYIQNSAISEASIILNRIYGTSISRATNSYKLYA